MAERIGAFEKMHMDEIEQRARMFRNLGRSREEAKRRITQNMEWEFELGPELAIEKKVAEIVNRVYRD